MNQIKRLTKMTLACHAVNQDVDNDWPCGC